MLGQGYRGKNKITRLSGECNHTIHNILKQIARGKKVDRGSSEKVYWQCVCVAGVKQEAAGRHVRGRGGAVWRYVNHTQEIY